MSFQKCPCCNGSGNKDPLQPPYTINSAPANCHVCNGRGIICELTGLPPKGNETSINTSTIDPRFFKRAGIGKSGKDE